MDWLTLSLTAAALWGGVSVVDKIIIEKHIPNPIIYAFFLGFYSLVSALVMGSVGPVQVAPIGATLLAFLSGIFYFVYILLYFAAISRNDATVVVALGQVTPLFASLWGYFLLGEVFSQTTYGGIIILVLGMVLISLEPNPKGTRFHFRLNDALQLMLMACLVRSFSDLLLKYPLAEINAWNGFFWPRLGIFAGTLTVFALPSTRQRLWIAIRQVRWHVNLLIFISETIALLGVLAITLAYERGTLTLVSTSASVQPLFILLFIGGINLVRKGTVPDKANLRLLMVRLPLLLLISIGTYLLAGG